MTPASPCPAELRVGTDLVSVSDVDDAIERFGDRYLRRVYTQRELDSCRMHDGWATWRLAARFAAKEATVKVLRPVDGIAYHSIEVVNDADGAPRIELSGGALARALDVGLHQLSLSVSHDGGIAVAMCAAMIGTHQ